MAATESINSSSTARRELNQGFGNALSMAFEFVAVVGILYFVGKRLGGPVGGGIGAVVGWIGATLRLYYRFAPTRSAVEEAKEATCRAATTRAELVDEGETGDETGPVTVVATRP